MTLALALALASALATSVAFLLKQRGAVLAPSVRVRHPLRSAADLFHSRWFALGWVVAVGAWGLHVGALSRAPLSVVQAVLAAGLVFLAVLAERFFGFALGRRQWIGVIITAVGLAIIALTVGPRGDDAPGYALTALIVVECTVFVLATGLAVLSSHLPTLRARQGLVLGAASGALFGVSDIALKFLTHAVGGGLLELISPWTFAALAASVVAFFASARGLQIGPGVEVIALTAVAANLTAIIGGILVCRDSIGTGGGGGQRTGDRVRARDRRRGPDPRPAPHGLPPGAGVTAIGAPQAAASIRAAIVAPVPGVKPTEASFG